MLKFNSKNTFSVKISKDSIDLYESLGKKIKNLTSKFKKKINKILLISSHSGAYTKFKEEFPDSKFILVNSFHSELNEKNDLSVNTYCLDIFNGSALTDFLMKFGKFDLLILIFDSKTFQKKNLKISIHFFFKHFLKKKGGLVLAFSLKDL